MFLSWTLAHEFAHVVGTRLKDKGLIISAQTPPNGVGERGYHVELSLGARLECNYQVSE